MRDYQPLPPIPHSKKDASTNISLAEILGRVNDNFDFDFDDEYPMYFHCPITLDIFKDPVTTNTGITFERYALEATMRAQMDDPRRIEEQRFTDNVVTRLADSGRSVLIDTDYFYCPITRGSIIFFAENKVIKQLIDEWPYPCNKYIIPRDAFILYKNIKDNQIPDKLLKLYNEIDDSKINDELLKQIPDKLFKLYNDCNRFYYLLFSKDKDFNLE